LPEPEIACDSLLPSRPRLSLSQLISGYLNLSQPKLFSLFPCRISVFSFPPTAIHAYPRLSAPIRARNFSGNAGRYPRFTLRRSHAPVIRSVAPFRFPISRFTLCPDHDFAQHFKRFQTCSKHNFYQPFGSAGALSQKINGHTPGFA
jgi:hypothetical protein